VLKGRLKIFIGVGIILLTVVFLGYQGFNESKTYYKFVDEIAAMGDEAYEVPLKVNGQVTPGTLHRTTPVTFDLRHNGSRINVLYTGRNPLPDMFTENSEVVVDGRLRKDKVFEAKMIQTKCASKYESDITGVKK